MGPAVQSWIQRKSQEPPSLARCLHRKRSRADASCPAETRSTPPADVGGGLRRMSRGGLSLALSAMDRYSYRRAEVPARARWHTLEGAGYVGTDGHSDALSHPGRIQPLGRGRGPDLAPPRCRDSATDAARDLRRRSTRRHRPEPGDLLPGGRGKGLLPDDRRGVPASLAPGTRGRSGDLTSPTRERITNAGEDNLDTGTSLPVGRANRSRSAGRPQDHPRPEGGHPGDPNALGSDRLVRRATDHRGDRQPHRRVLRGHRAPDLARAQGS